MNGSDAEETQHSAALRSRDCGRGLLETVEDSDD
jgi:hypothetical protein